MPSSATGYNTYRIMSAHLLLDAACRDDNRDVAFFAFFNREFAKGGNDLTRAKSVGKNA
jgi:hypothetical protein